MNQVNDNLSDKLRDKASAKEERAAPGSERLDRKERRNSLAAFLRAIKFRKPARADGSVERDFAQLNPRARQRHEDSGWIRSAN